MAKTQTPSNSTKPTPAIGDKVTYYCWHGGDAGELRSYDAVVVNVYQGLPLTLDLEVDLDDEVKAAGIITRQTAVPVRVQRENSIHAGGSWTLRPV